MKTLNKKLIQNYIAVATAVETFKQKTISKLKEEKGDEFVNKGILIIIGVVMGGLALGYMTGLFDKTIAPGVDEKVNGLLNHV